MRSKKGPRKHVGENKDGWKVFDSHSDDSSENGNGVFGDKLLQGHQKASLERDEPVERGRAKDTS